MSLVYHSIKSLSVVDTLWDLFNGFHPRAARSLISSVKGVLLFHQVKIPFLFLSPFLADAVNNCVFWGIFKLCKFQDIWWYHCIWSAFIQNNYPIKFFPTRLLANWNSLNHSKRAVQQFILTNLKNRFSNIYIFCPAYDYAGTVAKYTATCVNRISFFSVMPPWNFWTLPAMW